MKYDEYKKLEESVNNQSFNKNYKNINIVFKFLSYFGHIASIFLAFYFMSKIIAGAIDNLYIIFISSIILLSGLELLKRDVFNRFSISYIKDSYITKAIAPLLITSLLLIFFSFYSTINGAKQFSSKSKEIETETKNEIKIYKDSISLIYQVKIDVLENQNADLFESNKKLDDEARELPSNFISSKSKIRQRIDINNTQMEKNINLINNIKFERDKDIKEYESNLLSESDNNKEENSKNSFLFAIISTLIELTILGGVYFNEYYKFRSYKEFRDKIEKDPNYQKWLLYDQILSILITDETKMNQKLLSNKAIIDMCKVNDIIVLPKDLTDFMKVLSGLGIIKVSGSVKYIAKTKENAEQSLRKHFNII
jgi:cell division protein FtsB